MQRRFLSDPYLRSVRTAPARTHSQAPVSCSRTPRKSPAAAGLVAGEAARHMRVFPTRTPRFPRCTCCPTAAITSWPPTRAAGTAGGKTWRSRAGAKTRRATGGARSAICATAPRAASGRRPINRRGAGRPNYEAIFVQGRAEYRRRDEGIETHTEIAVSPEDDVEVRRVTLTNLSARTRTIELTSYAEVVLAPAERRPAPTRLQQSVRADRDSCWIASHSLHAPAARAGEKTAVDVPSDGDAGRRRRARRPTKPTGPSSSVAAAPWPTRPRSTTDGPALQHRGPGARSDCRAFARLSTCPPTRPPTGTSISGMAETREAALALIGKYRDPALRGARVRDGLVAQPGRAAPAAGDRGRGPDVRAVGQLGHSRQPAPPRRCRHPHPQPARPVRPVGLRDLGRPADRPDAHRRRAPDRSGETGAPGPRLLARERAWRSIWSS